MQKLSNQHFRLCILCPYAAHVITAGRFIMYICHKAKIRVIGLLFVGSDFYLVCPFRTTMNNILTQESLPPLSKLDSFDKGRLFEEYIKQLFNERHFKVKQWRKCERFTDGVVPFGHCLPDFELVFMGRREYNFAVECKWQKEFDNGEIKWADTKKINIYKQFQKERRLIVFVAIGIGRHPSNPEKLFVTPLDKICMFTKVSENDLMVYKRYPKKGSFMIRFN
jgi:hypothetical protein